MIVFDHRIEKKIHFSYDKFFFAYAELVRTGRTDVLWSNTKEANKFYECYKKIMDQCKLPLAEAYLQPSDLGTVFIGRILATTKEKYSSFDMIYWFTVKDNAQFEDIKRRIYWELPRVTDNGMQRLIINYSLE